MTLHFDISAVICVCTPKHEIRAGYEAEADYASSVEGKQRTTNYAPKTSSHLETQLERTWKQ